MKVFVTQSCLFVNPWTVALQAPLSMGCPRQEYWRGLPFPTPGDLPNPGIEPKSPALQADSLLTEPPGKPLSSQNTSVKRTFPHLLFGFPKTVIERRPDTFSLA